MNLREPANTCRPQRRTIRGLRRCRLALGMLGVLASAIAEGQTKPAVVAANEDAVALPAYNVRADRIEDFGFRVTEPAFTFVVFIPKPEAPFISEVLPNTAAAKAGLQPGDRILKSDGQSAAMTIFTAAKWAKLMRAKNAAAAAGKASVTWTLEIQPRGTTSYASSGLPVRGPLVFQNPRIVTLTLPTPPPRWGAAVWRAPEGRAPGTVAEPGPLAERSRAILDHGVWTQVGGMFLGAPVGGGARDEFPNGYAWTIGGGRDGMHRMTVTQAHGRTEVVLEIASPATGRWVYRTSPSGELERAWHFTRKKKGEVPLAEARAGFAHEVDLWANRVRKVSVRWPFEVIPGCDPNAIFAMLAGNDGAATPSLAPPRAKEFLQLPSATEEQRALLADALARLGADQDRWAYTESSRGFDDGPVVVTRVDPSKAENERCVLVSIGGQPPTPAQVQAWRDEGGDTPKVLGDLPPLENLVDLTDLRVATAEGDRVVFELPLLNGHADFPAEKFQARFRVNHTHRTLEEIVVKLRAALRVAGVAKITDAGFEVVFQTLDPALAAQPVRLKAGGGGRVLFVKISRAFESTRTEFRRVEPSAETASVETLAAPGEAR